MPIEGLEWFNFYEERHRSEEGPVKIVRLGLIKEEGVSHDPEIKKKVMLGPGEVPRLRGFSQAYFRPGQRASAHSHDDMYEIFLVEAGSGEIVAAGERHHLAPGTCVAVRPGEVHEIVNPGPDTLVLTYFGIEEG